MIDTDWRQSQEASDVLMIQFILTFSQLVTPSFLESNMSCFLLVSSFLKTKAVLHALLHGL